MAASMISFFCCQLCRNSRSKLSVLSSFYRCKNGQNVSAVPKSGFVPNVFKALSHRPEEFRAFFMYYDALMAKETGSLTKADKEMIVVATSAINNCLYCIISHSALFRIYSKNPTLADQVEANWECAELSPRQHAIVEFAVAICKSETITEEHFKKLEAHGLDREDAWDIGAIASFFALSNRMAHLTNMRPNKSSI